jgi:hypothetical protein
MLQIGKMNEIVEETLKHNINIPAVQEVRWKDSGKINKRNFTFFYSGLGRKREYGTGFIVDAKTKQSIIGFEPVNNRISKRFLGIPNSIRLLYNTSILIQS